MPNARAHAVIGTGSGGLVALLRSQELPPEARLAMTLGGRNPVEQREARDLGRFGLGLKTASFSQCRCLTVASRKSGGITVRRWEPVVPKTNWGLILQAPVLLSAVVVATTETPFSTRFTVKPGSAVPDSVPWL